MNYIKEEGRLYPNPNPEKPNVIISQEIRSSPDVKKCVKCRNWYATYNSAVLCDKCLYPEDTRCCKLCTIL